MQDLLKPDRVLIGSTQTPSSLAAAMMLKELYATWVNPEKILLIKCCSAELAKLVANAMLAQRISSIKSISAICERSGANIAEVSEAVGLDTRIGSEFLKAGLGFGGSCFKKDILSLIYLAKALNLPEVACYWQQVLDMNHWQHTRFVERILTCLHGTLVDKKIAILGYAFKQNTSDTRESLTKDVIKLLLVERPREIAIFDPRCRSEDIKMELQRLAASSSTQLMKPDGSLKVYTSPYEACCDSNAVLLLTEGDMLRYPPVDIVHSSLLDGNFDDNKLYREEPPCPENCLDCERKGSQEQEVNEDFDWMRVARSMRTPKWVFDGRQLVDVSEMEKLGFRVEAIGKPTSRTNDWFHSAI